MTRHLVLVALMMVTMANGQGPPHWEQSAELSRHPANVSFMTVKHFKDDHCTDFLMTQNLPMAVCITEEDMPGHSHKYLMHPHGLPELVRYDFNGTECHGTPIDETGTVVVTANCTGHPGEGSRMASPDWSISAVYYELYNDTTGCNGSIIDQGFAALDTCEQRNPDDADWGKHSTLDPAPFHSLIWHVHTDNAYLLFFTSPDCSGDPYRPAEHKIGGGVCAATHRGDTWYPGHYKAWIKKVTDDHPPPEGKVWKHKKCAWISRELARELNAVPHPDPHSASCTEERPAMFEDV